jgi:hypothetical protein
MHRIKPTAGIGDTAVAATVTSVVVTVLAAVTGRVRAFRNAGKQTKQEVTASSPARPPASAATGLGGASP